MVCDSAWESTVGLLGREGLEDGTGMLISNCRMIHMFFMRFPIDVVFVDSGFEVVKIVRNLKPWRVAFCPVASSVIELKAGSVDMTGLETGMKLELRD